MTPETLRSTDKLSGIYAFPSRCLEPFRIFLHPFHDFCKVGVAFDALLAVRNQLQPLSYMPGDAVTIEKISELMSQVLHVILQKGFIVLFLLLVLGFQAKGHEHCILWLRGRLLYKPIVME